MQKLPCSCGTTTKPNLDGTWVFRRLEKEFCVSFGESDRKDWDFTFDGLIQFVKKKKQHVDRI
jgi:hypothetical protein